MDVGQRVKETVFYFDLVSDPMMRRAFHAAKISRKDLIPSEC